MTPTAISHQTVRLARGKHTTPDRGACVMELASMLAGEPFSDRPQSVCPVVGALLRAINDGADDSGRQDLYRFASDAIGTRGGRELERARIDRCLQTLHTAEAARPGWRRALHRRSRPASPRTDAELERMSSRVVRAVRRLPCGHSRLLDLVDQLITLDPASPHGRVVAPASTPGTLAGGPA